MIPIMKALLRLEAPNNIKGDLIKIILFNRKEKLLPCSRKEDILLFRSVENWEFRVKISKDGRSKVA